MTTREFADELRKRITPTIGDSRSVGDAVEAVVQEVLALREQEAAKLHEVMASSLHKILDAGGMILDTHADVSAELAARFRDR